MGQFSWLDCIDKTQILDDTRADVYALIPAAFGGGHLHETRYDGYGHFDCQDIYAVVARWNAPEKCNGDDDHDREIGIDIACDDEDNARLQYPIKITHDVTAVYEDCQPSENDPYQGWFHKAFDPSKEMPTEGDVIRLGDESFYTVRIEHSDLMDDDKIFYRSFDRDYDNESIVYIYGDEDYIWADDFNRDEDYDCETIGKFDNGETVNICVKYNPNWEKV